MFFLVNNEGLRFVLPDVIPATIPTPAFANAVMNNIAALQPNELSTYKKMFNLWADAPGPLRRAVRQQLLCNALTLAGFNPATQACAEQFEASPTRSHPSGFSPRVDYKIDDNDNAYFRYRLDHGTQPTTSTPSTPTSMRSLISRPMTISSRDAHLRAAVDQPFPGAFSHYVAQFAQNHQLANSTFPYDVDRRGPLTLPTSTPCATFRRAATSPSIS